MYRNRNRGKSKQPREPEERDTSAPIGFADVQGAATQVYLVKMPNFLIQKFSKPVPPGQAGPVVGRLRIPSEAALTYNPNRPAAEGEPEVQKSERARIFIDHPQQGKRPDTFELLFQQEAPKTYVFTENPNGPAPNPRVEGSVVHMCTAQPALDTRYRSINRARTIRASKKTRVTMVLDDSERRQADNKAFKSGAVVETAKQREDRKKSKEMSRKHLDLPTAEWRLHAKRCIFKAFEISSHYSADQLASDLDEPVNRLRSVINEVCIYNKSGPNSGKYELREEFKTVKQRMLTTRERDEHREKEIENAKRKQEERAERERPNKRSKN